MSQYNKNDVIHDCTCENTVSFMFHTSKYSVGDIMNPAGMKLLKIDGDEMKSWKTVRSSRKDGVLEGLGGRSWAY